MIDTLANAFLTGCLCAYATVALTGMWEVSRPLIEGPQRAKLPYLMGRVALCAGAVCAVLYLKLKWG